MSPVWRPLLAALATETEVTWVAEARCLPTWLASQGVTTDERASEQLLRRSIPYSPALMPLPTNHLTSKSPLSRVGASEGMSFTSSTRSFSREELPKRKMRFKRALLNCSLKWAGQTTHTLRKVVTAPNLPPACCGAFNYTLTH